MATNIGKFCQIILLLIVSIPYRLATNQGNGVFEGSQLLKVSIPYRLATNGIALVMKGRHLCVSIPYRLATNKIETKLTVEKEKEFQFLIGWLQTCVRYHTDF